MKWWVVGAVAVVAVAAAIVLALKMQPIVEKACLLWAEHGVNPAGTCGKPLT